MGQPVEVDAVIIGGGIVGLLTALEAKRRHRAWEAVLLEQAPFLADHSTGRNSGVLHSGLYYPTGSLKHRLCMEGLDEWRHLLLAHALPHRFCGKVVFAHDETERPRLDELQNKARANGVPVRRASSAELGKAQAHVNAVDALVVASTGIVDVSSAMAFFRHEFEKLGGIVLTGTPATATRDGGVFHVNTADTSIVAPRLVNAAGLWAPEFRTQLGLKGMASRWVKGHYLRTSQKLGHETLYYPIPPPDLKGLGVHSTIDCQGDVKFGPDTLDVDAIDYRLEPQDLDGMRSSILRCFKGVDPARLFPDYAGIRSKIVVEGKLHTDFWLENPLPGYAEACGIESPGMTAAPAIARRLLDMLG